MKKELQYLLKNQSKNKKINERQCLPNWHGSTIAVTYRVVINHTNSAIGQSPDEEFFRLIFSLILTV